MPRNPNQNMFPVLENDLPLAEGVTPSGALGALTSVVKPQAKEATEALKGTAPKSEERDPTIFNKGFLKGIDKQVFLGMLADALTSIGGGESQGMTRQAIEARAQRIQLRARQKELADQREFDAEQAAARLELERDKIDVKVTGDDLDRKHETSLANLRIQASKDNLERNAVLEEEAREKSIGQEGHARVIASYFDDISTMDITLAPGENYEAALKDPVIAERIRLKVAPIHEARRLDQLDLANSKNGKRQREVVLPEVNRAMELWRQGKAIVVDPVSGEPSVQQTRGSLQERIRATFQALPPNEVMSDEIIMPQMSDVALQYLDEFRLEGQGAYYSLDRELQAIKTRDVIGMVQAIMNAELNRRREQVRSELLDPRNFPVPLTPEEEARRRQREQEAALSATGGTSR